MALKSKAKALQEEVEEFEEDFDDEDELSLLSKRFNRLWKKI